MDTSFLLGAQGVQAPNTLLQGIQAATLGDLLGRGQLQQYALKSQQRADAAQEAMNRAIPGVMQGGWSPESIQSAISANPDSASGLLKMLEDRQKAQADIRKTNAGAGKDEASAKVELLKPLTNQAYALANDPSLTPDKIKQWSMNVANAGLQGLVQTIPFGDWNNPDAARKNLKIAGSAFFEAEKQVSTAETARANQVNEAQHAANYASEAERRKAETSIGWANVKTAQGHLGLERDKMKQADLSQPFEVTVDGRQILAQQDKRSGTLLDVNTRQPINGAVSPKMSTQMENDLLDVRKTSTVLDRMIASFKPEYVGALGAAGEFNDQYTSQVIPGVGNEDRVKFRQNSAMVTNNYIKAITGATVGQGGEQERLMRAVPVAGDSSVRFKAKMKEMRANLDELPSIIANNPNLRQSGASGQSTAVVNSATTPAKPTLGEKRGGYTYKGGDPASPDSWAK